MDVDSKSTVKEQARCTTFPASTLSRGPLLMVGMGVCRMCGRACERVTIADRARESR